MFPITSVLTRTDLEGITDGDREMLGEDVGRVVDCVGRCVGTVEGTAVGGFVSPTCEGATLGESVVP